MSISIDTFTDLRPEDLCHIGPVASVYNLQLHAERAQRHFEDVRASVYARLEQIERDANSQGKSAFGMSSMMDVAERDPALIEARKQMDANRQVAERAQEDIGGIVFCPPLTSMEKITKKLAALNKRTERTNDEPAKFIVTDERIVLNYVYDHTTERAWHGDFEHAFVIVTPARPLIPGFEFIATIQHTEHGNIVRRIPPIAYGIRHNLDFGDGHVVPENESKAAQALNEIDLTRYYDADPTCDHCHKIRSRKDTYVVYNEAEGKTLRVGRSCLRDYTGIDSAEKVIKGLEQFYEFFRSLNSRGEQPSILTTDFMAHSAALVRGFGGYQRGMGWDALSNYTKMQRDSRSNGQPDYIIPTEQDEAEGRRIMEWARAWDEQSDFAQSVRVAVSGDVIPEKGYGIAAAAFVAKKNFDARQIKQAEREEQRKAAEGRQFIAQPGQRIELQVKVLSINSRPGYMPDTTSYTIRMEDEAGDRLTWFASNMPYAKDTDYMLAEGGVYDMRASVKNHEDHERYGKTTIIQRANFPKTISEPDQED